MTCCNIDNLPWFIEDYLRIGLVFNALLTGIKILYNKIFYTCSILTSSTRLRLANCEHQPIKKQLNVSFRLIAYLLRKREINRVAIIMLPVPDLRDNHVFLSLIKNIKYFLYCYRVVGNTGVGLVEQEVLWQHGPTEFLPNLHECFYIMIEIRRKTFCSSFRKHLGK